MKDKCYAEVSEVIEIIQNIYEVWIISVKNRIANLERINIDSFVELVKHEQENGNIKSRKDLIKYIENITQD